MVAVPQSYQLKKERKKERFCKDQWKWRMRAPFNFLRLPGPSNFPKIFRQIEHDMETVINVLQPGPLGIVEHKFSASELHDAKVAVAIAVSNWRMNTALEKSGRDVKNDPIVG